MKVNSIIYALDGMSKRYLRKPKVICPSCQSESYTTIDRKFPYRLVECSNCHLLHRYPFESEESMRRFYQLAYRQKGLTTDLPSDDELNQLLESNFEHSTKSFARIIKIIQALDTISTPTVLDYGASWGYGSIQLKRAGFDVCSYEISKPRAEFGNKLGLNIYTDIDKLRSSDLVCDIVYSGHVLEHTNNPLESIKTQMSFLKPGGYLIAHTPNGSSLRRHSEPSAFNKHWGRVHPVLLSDKFISENFPNNQYFITDCTNEPEQTGDVVSRLKAWNTSSQYNEMFGLGELFFVIKKI